MGHFREFDLALHHAAVAPGSVGDQCGLAVVVARAADPSLHALVAAHEGSAAALRARRAPALRPPPRVAPRGRSPFERFFVDALNTLSALRPGAPVRRARDHVRPSTSTPRPSARPPLARESPSPAPLRPPSPTTAARATDEHPRAHRRGASTGSPCTTPPAPGSPAALHPRRLQPPARRGARRPVATHRAEGVYDDITVPGEAVARREDLPCARVSPLAAPAAAQARPMIEHTSSPPRARCPARASASSAGLPAELPRALQRAPRPRRGAPRAHHRGGARRRSRPAAGRFQRHRRGRDARHLPRDRRRPRPCRRPSSSPPPPRAEVLLRGQNFAARPPRQHQAHRQPPMVVRSGDTTALRVIVPDGARTGPVRANGGGEARSPGDPARSATGWWCASSRRSRWRWAGTRPCAARLRRRSRATGSLVNGRPVRVLRASAAELEVEVPVDAQGGAIAVSVQGGGRYETAQRLSSARPPSSARDGPPRAAPGGRVALRWSQFGTDAPHVQVTGRRTRRHRRERAAPQEVVITVP